MNLLKRLYYVYYVFPPVLEEENYVCILSSHDDYLGCSEIKGIFLKKDEAIEFGNKVARKLKVNFNNSNL